MVGRGGPGRARPGPGARGPRNLAPAGPPGRQGAAAHLRGLLRRGDRPVAAHPHPRCPAGERVSFTHLNVASAFSAHYGVSWPHDLALRAAAEGAEALANTERDGLYGAVKHLKACRETGLDPILGVNLAILAPAVDATRGQRSRGRPRLQVQGRVIVLAKGNCSGAGYRALCRLVSLAHEGTPAHRGATGKPVGVTPAELAGCTTDPEDGTVLAVLLGPDSDVG